MRHDLTAAPRVGLLVIILIAFALRVVGLDRLGLAYDEATTALMSRASPAAIIAFHWDAAFEHPPLWVLLMHSWSALAGQREFALRILPALAGVLLIPALWRLTRAVWPRMPAVATIAAGLVAVSPVMVYYSQEARMYTLVVLLAVLTTYLARRLPDDRRAVPAFVVATWCMVGLHYYAALVTALLALVLVVRLAATRPPRWGQWARLLAILVLAVAPLLAWMALAPGFHETLTVVRTTAATSPLSASAFFDDLWRELSFGSIRWLPPQSVWGYSLLPLVGLGAVAAVNPARRPAAWMVVLLALTPMLSATLLLRTLSTRYILYSVPFLWVLVAWGVVWSGQLHRWIGGAALALTLAVATLGLVYYTGPYVKSDYRAMAADLVTRVNPATDIVVLEAPRQHLLAKYYFPSDWPLAPVPQIDVPDFWPLTAPPLVPENEDDRIQAWLASHPSLWVIYTGEGEVDRGEFLAKYLAAVAYTQDCDRWLDVRDCHYVSPHAVQPAVAGPLDLRYGNGLAVTAAALSLYAPYGAASPQSILVQLDWRALVQPTADVKASLRLIDAGGAVLAQTDELPIGPLLPPTTWAAGDDKPGYFTIELPTAMTAGDYRIEYSLYDPATLAVVPPFDATGVPQPDPRVLAVLRVDDTMHLLSAR